MLVKLFLCYVFHDTKSRYSMNWSQFYCLYQLNWQIASCNIMDSSSDVIFEMKYWEILWYSLQWSFMKNFIDVFQLVCFRNHFFVIIGFNSLFMTCNSVGEPNLICFIYIPQNNAWYIYYNFIAFDTWSNSMDIQTDRNILVDFLQILIYLALVATFSIKIVLLVFSKYLKQYLLQVKQFYLATDLYFIKKNSSPFLIFSKS